MTAALRIQTYEGSEQKSFAANSHLITGANDALLVDTQYARSDARNAADMVRASGRRLRSVFVTHSHPDHHLGLEVIAAEFPEARVLATPAVVDSIKRRAPEYRARWKPIYGNDLADDIVVPEPVSDGLELEGETIQVIEIGPGEAEVSSAMYVPSLKALLPADAIYNGIHVWLVEGRPREQLAAIARLRAVGEVERIYPGHGPAAGPELFETNERYIRDFLEATAPPATKDEALARMQERYGGLRLPLILAWSVEAAVNKKSYEQIVDEFIASMGQSG